VIAGPRPGVTGDRSREVRVQEEVLTQRPLRSDPVALGQRPQGRGSEGRALTHAEERSHGARTRFGPGPKARGRT
jgi:hypothetical protein